MLLSLDEIPQNKELENVNIFDPKEEFINKLKNKYEKEFKVRNDHVIIISSKIRKNIEDSMQFFIRGIHNCEYIMNLNKENRLRGNKKNNDRQINNQKVLK